ncbi:amidase [Marinobacter segnicrescens]|uniref:Amidase n=1 Tax=Marinobacter segnicrescens TaxID=430453 RepID=A0A1H9YUC0_9GAMM|nr:MULTISPECIES: amidase family protein [Marinobacter]UZD64415.1 amidase family protein [Marinobacter sp. AN1]SES72671.1 amidase [Marinobacter segnicrescens]
MSRLADELCALSATDLATAIRRGDLSAVEVTEATLARIEDCNPVVNALCTLNTGAAIADARRLDRQRQQGEPLPSLAGVPVGIKDITATAGLRTTFGSPLCRNHVPAYDAEVVARLRRAGAIVIGKTNTPEFAAGANTVNPVFGATRNPWNPALSAGGSTGGGAAALATGMIALAQGTDLGGSLRNPAAFCGVVGLRPTPGLVPSAPNPAPWDSLQVDGPMARTSADTWLALQAMAGSSRHATLSTAGDLPGRGLPLELQPAPRRVAYIADIAGFGIDPAIATLCREAAGRLSASGCEVVDLELDLAAEIPAYLTLRGQVIVSQLLPWLDQREALGPNLQANLETGLALSTRDIAHAQHRRAALRQRLLALLDDFDALLTPTTTVLPFPVAENYPSHIAGRPMTSYIDWVAQTFLWSLPGFPVASVPAGFTDCGLPVGLQIMTGPWQDARALALAQRIEDNGPFRLASPHRGVPARAEHSHQIPPQDMAANRERSLP